MRAGGEMSTISAMSEEEIKELIDHEDLLALTEPNTIVGKKRLAMARLILTWATAKAEAERANFDGAGHTMETNPAGGNGCRCYDRIDGPIDERHWWKNEDWLNSVLFRIGWPKEA